MNAPSPARPVHRWRLLLVASMRESLRDRGLLALAVGGPVAVVLLTLVAARFLVPDGPWTVQVGGRVGGQVGGQATAVEVLVGELDAAGVEVLEVGTGTLAGPGPGVDATIVVGLDRAVVRTGPSSVLAVDDLRTVTTEALPGFRVDVEGPDGRPSTGVAGYLLPSAVALTAVLLGAAGTAGRVVGWRRRGTVALLVVSGLLGTGPRSGLRAALVLVPSRLLLLLPAVVVAGAASGAVAGGWSWLPQLLVLSAVGGACCTTSGVLLGCVLRSRREARVASWVVVVLVAVFGGVLVPVGLFPQVAAAVVSWAPPAVLADGLRALQVGEASAQFPARVVVLVAGWLVAVAGVYGFWRAAVRPKH